MLGFKAKAKTGTIQFPSFADGGSIHGIGGEELDPGFSRPDLHHPPGIPFEDPGCKTEASRWFIQNPVMVVAAGYL